LDQQGNGASRQRRSTLPRQTGASGWFILWNHDDLPFVFGISLAVDLGLKGRVALITGASKGIGKAIALGLAAEGVRLALLARTEAALQAAAGEIRAATGATVLAIPTDIRDAAAVSSAVERAHAELGTLHVLVNNAGGPIKRPERQIQWPDADWRDDIDTKTLGMLRVTQAMIPHMPTDGTGRIINISGIAGSSVLTSALTHGLNNAAMNHVTGYLAADLAAARITVNAVLPGLIATEWREGWAENASRQRGVAKQEFLDATCRDWGIIAGRWGTMREVADAVVFIASDRAAYINGAKLTVDGGYAINVRG
jgi:NAD(P)-dependent dehydrogenase (short-subunit alcohol dehydrogenase family)